MLLGSQLGILIYKGLTHDVVEGRAKPRNESSTVKGIYHLLWSCGLLGR